MVLCPTTVFVCPGQEINTASFADCFTVRAALSLNVCLFYSMTSLSKVLGSRGKEKQTRTSRLTVTAMLALIDENGIVKKFSLHSVKAKIYHS